MEDSYRKTRRGYIKFRGTQRTAIWLILGVPTGFVLVVLLLWGGVRVYDYAESRHLSRRAAAYLSGGDLRQAALSARRATELDATNANAMDVLARVAEASNDRSALDWRRKILEADPHSVEKRLALVTSALQFNDIDTAEKNLREASETAANTAPFHAAAARLAESKKELTDAENHWAKASELAPNDKFYRLQLGIALLRSEESSKREKGLSILEDLRRDEKQRVFVLRALIADGIARRSDSQTLAELARDLQGCPEAGFNDKILYAEILRQLRDPNFTVYLTELEKDAIAKSADLAGLLSWMNANKMSLLAIDFVRGLPSDVVNKWPVPLVMAESYAKLADWPRLEEQVKNSNWGQFDFMRHAYLALALRSQSKIAAADKEWALAEKGASVSPQFLSMLTRVTSDWRWEKEWRELLWTLAKHPAAQMEALEVLYKKCVAEGDTPGLYRVLVRLAEIQPGDSSLQNNLAQVSLLVKADVERAQKIAAELHQKDAANPAYASTYAFSLFSKGDTAGALKIMNGLSTEQLQDPSLSAYYGIMLAAAGDGARAREYIARGKTAKLLPEEKELLATAESRIQ